MPRYIDADKLCELARNHIDRTVDCNDIMRFPLANVVEVVRCKDCEYFYKDESIKVCKHWNCHTTTDDAYCSFGERRKSNADGT